MSEYSDGYELIKNSGMYGADEFTAILMHAVQLKVKESKSNEDFRDWSIDYIIKTCTNHGEKEKEIFGKGL